MVFMGTLFLVAAVACLFVALDLAPTRRITRERLSGYAVVEQPTVLNRVASAVEGGVETLMKRRGWRPFSAEEMAMAGVRMPVSSLVVLMGCGALLAVAVGTMLANLVFGLVMAALVPVLVKMWLTWAAGRTRRKFGDQLPQALQLMAASLRAGHSLPRVLDAVSQEADAPMGPELARVVNETRLGRDLIASLEDVAERMQCRDFYWVAGAIDAQRETGGNLNEILDQVCETIRDRQHVRQQVKALSAEGRLSAVILMALPVGIGGYYSLVAGEQFTTFVDSGIGKLLLLGSAVMYVLGGFWMRSVVRIEF